MTDTEPCHWCPFAGCADCPHQTLQPCPDCLLDHPGAPCAITQDLLPLETQ